MKFEDLGPQSQGAVGVHFSWITQYLRTKAVEIHKASDGWGYVIEKGNWAPPHAPASSPPGIDHLFVGGLHLSLRDRVLHERVLIISGEIPIRSHEEVDNEVAINIGDVPITYIIPRSAGQEYDGLEKHVIAPGRPHYTVRTPPPEIKGFHHGFAVPAPRTGLLYVAKALKPEFVDGNSFQVPENSFNG